MLEDLLHQTVTPGMPTVTLNCRAWMEHRSRIGPYKTGAYLGWTAAGALDCMIQGNTAGARARLALMMLMLDQCATDRGSWALASELSLEQAPPMAALSAHSPPAANSEAKSLLSAGSWTPVGRRLRYLISKKQKIMPVAAASWDEEELQRWRRNQIQRAKQKPRRRPWLIQTVNEDACCWPRCCGSYWEGWFEVTHCSGCCCSYSLCASAGEFAMSSPTSMWWWLGFFCAQRPQQAAQL